MLFSQLYTVEFFTEMSPFFCVLRNTTGRICQKVFEIAT